ncbi:hypothetical protein OESDEN_25483 [Oesophagostomum dentatum]|uniref:Uncharacterized protein n=1 Tax=Oesophagostomum dentatum TaxID=61180 RepID=A0A0B1RTD5_OESDE|nr:hypothetical protein OESDEN_25483 [Oesophagostomum dentatum]
MSKRTHSLSKLSATATLATRAHLDHQEHPENRVSTANQEHLESLALQDLLVLLHQSPLMLSKAAASAPMAHVDPQDHPEKLDQWDRRVFPVIQEDKEKRDVTATLDNLVFLEKVVNQEKLESLVHLEEREFVALRDPLVRRENKDHRDKRVRLDILDVMDNEEVTARSGPLDLPDKWECLEKGDNRESLELQDNLDLTDPTVNAPKEAWESTSTRSQLPLSHQPMNLRPFR